MVRRSAALRRCEPEGGEGVDDADGFEADADDLADEADDVFGVVGVGVGADAGAGVFGDAVLIDHPLKCGPVAEAVFEYLGRDAGQGEHDYRVTAAGPMTLAAILNSLQMGFRTLAIQKRSSEVWEVLGAVKTEFSKYSDMLAKVHKKLQEANNTVEAGLTRTRAIQRKLKGVQEAGTAEAIQVIETGEEGEEAAVVGTLR